MDDRGVLPTFEQGLRGERRELPFVWDEGRYRFYRVADAVQSYPTKQTDESRLSVKLRELREAGVKVIDHKRVDYFRDGVPLCDWLIKTMIPRT